MSVAIYPAFTASGVKVTSAVGDGPRGVRFDWPDGRTAFSDLPEQGMYVDACDFNGGPVAIVTGHDTDTAYLVVPTGHEPLAKTHGIRPCAINVVDGVLRWMFVHTTTQYIDTGEVKPLPPEQLSTSQGILALEPSGRINWADPPDRVESGLYHKVNADGASAGLLASGDQLTVLTPEPHTVFNGLCHNIRIVKRDDGTHGICARNGAAPIFVVGPPWPDFIDPATQLPPLDSVPLLNRPFGLACYTFNNAETLGNLTLPIRPSVIHLPAQFIATGDDEHLIEDEALWALYSGESSTVPSEQAIHEMRPVSARRKRGLAIYQDSYPMRESVMDLSEDGDILTPQVFRNAGEDLGLYRGRLRTAFMDGSIVCETWPTINIHQRYSGPTPTLSVKDVVDGFVTACQIAEEQGWPGMVLFRVGTMDMPAEIVPYIERFMDGITGTPKARILEDEQEPEKPEEPDVMPYVVLTKQDPKIDPVLAVTKVKEIAQGDKVFLEKTNGRIVTVTPDGKIEDRPPGTFGPWEELIKSAKGYVAERDGDHVYVIVTA